MRRRRRSRRPWYIAAAVVVIGVGTWWFWPGGEKPEPAPFTEPSAGTKPLIAATNDASVGERIPEVVLVEAGARPESSLTEHTASRRESAPGGEIPAEDELLKPLGSRSSASASTDSPLSTAAVPPSPESQPESAAPVTAADTPGVRPSDTPATSGGERLSSNPRINASLLRYRAGEVIAARTELNRMLEISRDSAEQVELRRHLQAIAEETIFSRERRSDDPLFESYTVQSGEYLINIGKRFKVPHEALMLINGISDPTRVRAGQALKAPRGPFHVRILRSQFRMDVYLQDVYVRSFPVGLGADQGTPLGEWLVKERLPNPTYYPPPSAEIKKIISPNDPLNPLGEHWIGLEGISGEAVGRTGYGIHGTIEPESIGKAVSLGCIRMYNHDVEFVYKLMMPGASKVTILP